MATLQNLDAEAIRRWCYIARNALSETRSLIDALNVFPVPDHDTGTNLYHTMQSAVRSIAEVPSEAKSSEVWVALVHGSLIGACGNSGVIISQLLRGMAEICAQEPKCDSRTMRRALKNAAEQARKAVTQPVEGTMLTVADSAADIPAGASDSLTAMLAEAASRARIALLQTTSQLPVLSMNGTVDAGAAGLCIILDALKDTVADSVPQKYEVPLGMPKEKLALALTSHPMTCYEVTYLLDAPVGAIEPLRQQLKSAGEAIIGGGNQLWRIHVHTTDAARVIETGMQTGRIHNVTIVHLP
jgi:dihydroxyacetone kinase-like predicted kinase